MYVESPKLLLFNWGGGTKKYVYIVVKENPLWS